MAGWIKLHRSIQEHWLYTEKRKFSKFEAWNDILLTVNFTEGKTIIKGKLIQIKRGESILSLDSWAKRWGWDKSAVRRFLNTLQKDNMIELKNETITTRLIVCKYDTYQDMRNADETQMKHKRNADETHLTPIEEGKEGKEEKEEIIDVPAKAEKIDFEKLIEFINKNTGRNFKVINKTVKGKYLARLKDGYSKQDILDAVSNSIKSDFHKGKNFKYLTPEFFSRSETLDKYSNTNNKPKENNVNKSLIPKGVSYSGPQY